MDCADCGHHNRDDARFCNECGRALGAVCPSCASEQPPAAKFCNQCGMALLAATPPAVTTPSAVRKSVTAVFVDLVGSTAFGERLDPEAVRAAIAPYHELVRTTVEDHAGTLVKFMGDGAMAVFGLPEVAEDDAIRAVSAGADLQRRFHGFADAIRDRYGVELGLRVGVNSGELVVADDDADLVGDVLNTAARLESACEPGAVLVGEDTWRLTRSMIEYEVLGEVRVKGKADPIATFRVVDDERTIADDIPFVGRRAELDELLAAFGEARDSPVARLVTVIGAPGVGKTRLAAELRGGVDARSFDLRFERRGSTTFTPVAQLLREVTDGTVEAVTRLVAEHPDAARLVPILQSFLGHGRPRTTEESFWAVRRLLEHLAAIEPLIIVVDDIQWAEPLFWDLLDHLVEWAKAPVLIVALARPELRELRPELAHVGRRVAASIALEGLDDASTRELAARLLDTDELPPNLLQRIPDSTEGNPLFVRELVQMLVDDGTLAHDGDRWRLTIDADAIEVPPTIMSLLASRVERLPDDERELVELASVIGTDFDRGTLGAIAPAAVSGRLGALLDRLRRKDLIEPSGTWAGDHPVYRFHHVLIRDAAYRRLLKGRRADLHELVGRYYDTDAAGETTSEVDVVVAHHYEQTVRYREELGDADDATRTLATAAVGRLHRAADEALAREDLPAAGGYARRALALVGPEEPVRDELLVLGCEALLSSGDATGATPLVRELHERSSDDRLAAWADCFRAQRWSLTDADRLVEAAELADDAATRLGALDDQAGVARARLVRASCLVRLGRVAECEEELDLALGAARSAGDRRRTVAVLGAAPLAALWGPSPVARAGGRCLDVLRLLRITTASPAVEATSVRCQGMLEALRGRFDSAREKLETSRATANELGLRQGLFETEWFAGFVEMWAGDPTAAEPHLRAARDGLGRLGIGADAGQAAAMLARALLVRGDVDGADRLAQEALDAAGQNLQTAIASRATLAEVRAAQGEHEAAAALIDEALAIADPTDIVLDRAIAQRAAARVAAARGDATAAARHAQAAADLLESKGVSTERLRAPVQGPDTTGVDIATPELSNTAMQVAVEAAQAFIDGDRDRYLALAHDDYVMRVHAPLSDSALAGMELSRAEQADVTFDQVQTIEAPIVYDVVAVRGDDLCLKRASTRGDEAAIEWYLVIETRDGRLAQEDWFARDQLADAERLLESRWREGSGSATSVRTDQDDTVPDDSLPDDTLPDDTVPDTGFARDPAPPEEPGGHGEQRDEVANDAVDRSAPDALPWPRGDEPPVDIGNTAWRLTRDLGDVVRERARWYEFLHPDFVSTARYRMNVGQQLGRDDFIDINVVQIESVQRFDSSNRLIAWRDDDLCLAHLTLVLDDNMLEYLIIVQVTGDQITSMDLFDQAQLTEALDELDRRWVELGGPVQHTVAPERIRRAFADRDVAALRGCVSDDFLAFDHRPLGVGLRDADQWAASMQPLFADDGSTIPIWRQFARYDDDVALYELDLMTKDGSSWPIWVLQVVVGDRYAHTDMFEPEQLDLALARFDELRIDRSVLGDDIEGVDRRRLRAVLRNAVDTGDAGDLADLVSDDMVFDVRRRTVKSVPGGKADWLVAMTSYHDVGLHYRSDLVAAPGPRVSLANATYDSTDGDEIHMYVLGELNDDGLLAYVGVWDMDDLPTARAELARRSASDVVTRLTGCVTADPEVPADADGRLQLVNDAVRLAELFTLAWLPTRDVDLGAYVERDFEFAGRRRSAESVDGGIDVFRSLLDFWSDHGIEGMANRVIAIRGDDLALAEQTIVTDGGDEMMVLSIGELGPSGRWRRLTFFDADQLREAVDELDRRWATTPERRQFVDRRIALRAAFADRDLNAIHRWFSPGAEVVDHRPLGFGTLAADQWTASLTPLLQDSVELVVYDVEIVDVGGGVVLARHVSQGMTVGERKESWVIEVHDTRGVARNEFFPLDDRSGAVTRLGELTDTSPPTAHPSPDDTPYRRSVAAIEEAWIAADLGSLAAVMVSDVVIQSFRTVATPGDTRSDEAITATLALVEFFPHVSIEIVAERSDDLGLGRFVLRNDDEMELTMLIVGQVGPDARIVRMATFDHDQLLDALELLGEWWGESGGREATIHAERLGRMAFAVPGIDREHHPFTDDFETIDHRLVGLGRRDLQTFFDSAGFISPSAFVVRRYFGITETVSFYEVQFVRDEDGFLWHAIHVNLLDAEGVRVNHVFDVHQLAEAEALFAELTASPRPGGPPPVENRATKVHAAIWEAVLADDRAALDGLYHAEFGARSLRSGSIHWEGGRDEIFDRIVWWRDHGAHAYDTEILATRSDCLAVLRRSFRTDDGSFHQVLIRVEVDDEGRLIDETAYDPDRQLADALDDLDTRWVTMGGDTTLAATFAGLRAGLLDGDADRLRATVAHDFVLVDHQRVGFGELGPDEWIATMEPLLDDPPVTWNARQVVAGRHPVWLVGYRMTDRGSSWDRWLVIETGHDGARRAEMFDALQYEAALARFEELAARSLESGRDAPPPVENEATRLHTELADATRTRDRAGMRSRLTEDFGYENWGTIVAATDGTRLDRDEWIAHAVEGDDQFAEAVCDVVAIRGDHLALTAVTDHSNDGTTSSLLLHESEGGRLSRIVRFDPDDLDAALDELDRRSGSVGADPVHHRAMRDLRVALRDGDRDLVRAGVADDYVMVDHQQVGFGTMDADAWIATMEPVLDQAPVTWIVRQIVERREDLRMVRYRMILAGSTWDRWLIVQFRGDVTVRAEMFDLTQWSAARTRFDELVAAQR